MSILNVNTIQPIGSGTTVTVAATELKTSNFITVGTGASVTSPSANVLTLGTNNAERLRITSAGLIGIGTISPSGPIHAHVASGTQRSYLEASAAHSFLRLKSGSTSYNSGLEFFSGASNIANINGLGAGGLQFEVNGSERLRIDNGGRLGLGVVPEAFHSNNKAVIRGDSGYTILGRGDNSLNISQNFYYDSSDAGKYIANGEASLYNQSDGSHNFYSAVSGSANAGASMVERLRIDSAGTILTNAATIDNTSSHGVIVAHAPASNADTGYKSIEIGNSNGSGSSRGSTICGQPKSNSHPPYTLIGSWDDGSNTDVYYGGGFGSNMRPATRHRFYTNSSYPTANGSGTERLRITSSGHVLRPTMAAAAVTLSADQTTLSTFNGSYQTLALNSEGYDNANNFNTSNYRFVAPETGFYNIGCNVQLEGGSRSASGNRWMYLYPIINGSAPGTSVGGNQADFDPADTHYYSWNWSSIMKLSQNDYVEWKYTGNLDSINLRGQGQSVFYFYQVG